MEWELSVEVILIGCVIWIGYCIVIAKEEYLKKANNIEEYMSRITKTLESIESANLVNARFVNEKLSEIQGADKRVYEELKYINKDRRQKDDKETAAWLAEDDIDEEN